MSEEEIKHPCPLCDEDVPGEALNANMSYVVHGEERHMFTWDWALAYLLALGVVFVHESEKDEHFRLLVNCSDTFAWACADAEELKPGELKGLYDRVWEDPVWGSTFWACIKRNERPMPQIERGLKKIGKWTEEMESLPVNSSYEENERFFRLVASHLASKKEEK